MKKYILLLVMFVSMNSFAQIVDIPDANFKAKLLSAQPWNNIAKNLSGVYFKIDSNNNGQIEINEALQVSYLRLYNNFTPSITSLSGVESFINLIHLTCYNELLQTLDISSLSYLEYLNCGFNSISNIDVSNNLNLKYLQCDSNPPLNSLNLTNNINLETLFIEQNNIPNLNLNSNVNLKSLYCYNINVNSLNLNNNILLENLSVGADNYTTLDLSENIKLHNLKIVYSHVSNLDLSNNNLLTNLECNNNYNLNTLNLKNGSNENLINFTNNFLNRICVDELQINNVLSQVNSNTTVSTYCSFTPGGNYNTITGSMLFDANNNGCDTNDTPQANIKININDGINQGATFTNNTGNYNFYTQAGSFDLTPNVENPTFFNFSPTLATIPFADNNNNTTTQNFCISANGVHPDVEVVIAPIIPARPGFDTKYQIVYKNKGNLTVSGNITFLFDDEVLDFVLATTSPDAQSQGLLNWNYQNLQPFENRSIYITLNVNSPQETPAVNINDQLQFGATITTDLADENSEDNIFVFNQTVVGSYDPNYITCIEGEVVPPSEIGEYLHYIINFENTGTAEAENIVVKVEVDPTKFDINSLQMLNTSHNSYIRQAGNKVEFIFQEIWLDTGGHGNVLLKIKSKNNLLEGDTVAKQANIYFDYNFPIETNIANTTFEVLSNGNFAIDESITVFPNPTNSIVNINCNNNIKSVEIYDVQGRLLQTQIVDNTSASLDISNQTNGIYFAKITSENGVKVEKISKE